MLTQAQYNGGGAYKAWSSSTVSLIKGTLVWNLNPGAAAVLRTPVATLFESMGSPIYVLYNQSGVNAITLQDSAGGALGTIPANNIALVSLKNNSTAAGIWLVRVSAKKF